MVSGVIVFFPENQTGFVFTVKNYNKKVSTYQIPTKQSPKQHQPPLRSIIHPHYRTLQIPSWCGRIFRRCCSLLTRNYIIRVTLPRNPPQILKLHYFQLGPLHLHPYLLPIPTSIEPQYSTATVRPPIERFCSLTDRCLLRATIIKWRIPSPGAFARNIMTNKVSPMGARSPKENDSLERKMGKYVSVPPKRFSDDSRQTKLPLLMRGTRLGRRVTEVKRAE